MKKSNLQIFMFCLFILITTFAVFSAKAQSGKNTPTNVTAICPFNHLLVPNDLKIGAIKIGGYRGAKALEEELSLKYKNKNYTRDLLDEVQAEVENSLTDETNQAFEKQIGIIGGARPAVIYTAPCVEVNTTLKTIDLIIKVMFLRADLENIANNILPIPRSIKPSFYNKMPAALRVLKPTFNFDYDRKTGPEATINISTNLLELSDSWKGEKTSDSSYRFNLNFSGRKSFSNRLYKTKTDLVLSKVRAGKLIEKLDLTLGFKADEEPLQEMNYVNNGLKLGGEIKLRPRFGVLNTIYVSGLYSNNSNKVYKQDRQTVLANRDNKFSFRSVIDGQLWNGFTRTGIWAESAKTNNVSQSYRRLAGMFGYQREFGKGTQTVGLEFVVGGGKAWGKVPVYATFFGGNNSASFLYESPDSAVMTDLPIGPLLRSYGKTQAAKVSQNGTISGSRSYWHSNLNITIPVRPWSRRLIPDETITFSNGSTKKLNELLESFTVGSAVGGIGDNLLDSIIEKLMKDNPTLTEAEAERLAVPIAQKEAERIVRKEIAPTMKFISRHANLFAVKPLIMLDAARLDGDIQGDGRYRFAVGGGLQFVVVLARAEIGYMNSLPRIRGESKGNFVFRMTFQNLF